MPTIHTNDIALYYETTGAGQPLVFIHGLGSSTRDWELQVAEFAKQYQVITFDLRGHGRTEKPAGPYSMALFAADMAGLLKALSVEAAHVVGLSLGGGVAFQLVADAPDLVKTLTIVNSAPELVLRSFKDRLAIWQRLLIVRLMGMKKMGEVLAPRLFPKSEHEAIRQLFVERWAENDQRAYLNALRALIGWSVTERLGAIRCPTLVIAADQDYTPVSHKEAYVAKIPSAQLVVIADSRHATPIEQPQKFNATLAEFLAKHG
jgi:pimeloyl-ACP methyl ester carboxylesterase